MIYIEQNREESMVKKPGKQQVMGEYQIDKNNSYTREQGWGESILVRIGDAHKWEGVEKKAMRKM